MIGHILALIDFSEYSGASLKTAAQLAEKVSASLTALYVRRVEKGRSQRLRKPIPTVHEHSAEDKHALDAFVEAQLGPDAKVRRVVVEGTPAYMASDWASRNKVDLIVCGTHGETGYGRVLLGSFTEKIVRLGSCPVWMVRAPQATEVPAKILCPTDLSTASAPAEELAAYTAGLFDATLVLLHVLNRPSRYGKAAELDDFYSKAKKDAEQAVRQLWKDRDVAHEVLVKVGDPAEQVVDVATELDVDLVVCGTHGKNNLKRKLLGSVAEQVVQLAPCSVLTVPHVPERIGISVKRS